MPSAAKFEMQDTLYEFPYHWLPHVDGAGAIRLHRQLAWGLDYLTYMTHVVRLVEEIAPESVCDVGCGDGRLLGFLNGKVPRVVGVDISRRAVAFAKAFNPGAEVLCRDVAELGETFGVVTLIEVLEHIPDDAMRSFIQAVSDRLSPEGRLVVTVPTKNVPTNPKHYRHYDLGDLVDTLAPEFEIESYCWLYRRGTVEALIKRILLNRFFALNYAPALRLAWRVHGRFSYQADSRNGSHLACVAVRRQ